MKKALVVIDIQKGFVVEMAEDLPQKIVDHLATNKADELALAAKHVADRGMVN